MWIIPLLVFLVTMYMIAFKENSLVLIIFSMGIMLHPIVTIPISIAVKFILSPRWKYCFSTVSYFAMICGFQIYLTLMWEKLNSQYFEDNKSAKYAFAYYKFNQCHCDQNEAYSCTLSEEEDPQFNIEDYLDVLGPLSTLPYFLMGMTSILALWNFGEIYFDVAIPILQFILGKREFTLDIKKPEEIDLPSHQSFSSNEESNNEQLNQTCETNVSEIDLENQQQLHSSPVTKKYGKWFNHQTMCLSLSVLYIIAIGLSPLIFSKANFWNDRECQSGFFDANSNVKILKCEGKYLHLYHFL